MPSKEQGIERTEELEACPFCGGEAFIENDGIPGPQWGECCKCGVGSHCSGTEKGAIKAWNRRAPSSRLSELDRIAAKLYMSLIWMRESQDDNDEEITKALREYEEVKKR